jgi:hypothetical protein
VKRGPDRHDQPAAGLQLVDQRLRNVLGRGGHDDDVEGRVLGPAAVAIAGRTVTLSYFSSRTLPAARRPSVSSSSIV